MSSKLAALCAASMAVAIASAPSRASEPACAPACPPPLAPAMADAPSAAAGPVAAGPGRLPVRVLPPGERVRLDGRLGDPAWAGAPVSDGFTQFLPVPGPAADGRWRTEVRVLVQDDAIVFGIRAFDPDPAAIRAPLLRRDQVMRDQDFIGVLLDTGGDRRAAQYVRVNPRGVVSDGLFIPGRTAQVEGNDGDEDPSPDFDVEAQTSIDAEGYRVELRLPFSTLRLPRARPDAPPRPWTAMVVRSIPRATAQLLTSVPIPREALSFIAAMAELDGLQDTAARASDASFLTARPALTLRASRDREGATVRRGQDAALGLDLKWRPRADWVFDATLNPDFSQVELDLPQLAGNTRFALSVPEKRPFFLESTDVLDLPLNAFYSRAITDPRAGVRATWRGLSADATGLAMRDDGGGVVLRPGAFSTEVLPQTGVSEVALLRGRWHTQGEAGRFSVGALASARQALGGGGNEVVGVDGLWRPDDARLLRAQALVSSTRDEPFAPAAASPSGPRDRGGLLALGYHHQAEAFSLQAQWQRTGVGFRNDNGFVEQSGVDRTTIELIRRHGEWRLHGLTAHEFETFVWFEQRQALPDPAAGIEAQTVSRRWHPGVWWTADPNLEAWAHLIVDAERVRPGGRLHGVRGVAAQVAFNPAPWFTRLTLEAQAGERVDVQADRVGRGHVLSAEARWRVAVPAWHPGRADPAPWGLELQQRLQQGTVGRPDGGRALTDQAWSSLAVLHLSERHSLRLVLQGRRTVRAAEPLAGLSAEDGRGSVVSLVAQRRLGVGRNLSAGFTRESGREVVLPDATPPGRVREEAFVKWAFEL